MVRFIFLVVSLKPVDMVRVGLAGRPDSSNSRQPS